MRSNLARRHILLLLAIATSGISGCSYRNFFGWVADSTYSSPVERQEVKDRINENWND